MSEVKQHYPTSSLIMLKERLKKKEIKVIEDNILINNTDSPILLFGEDGYFFIYLRFEIYKSEEYF